MNKFSLAVHGGAGTILKSAMTPAKEKLYRQALADALAAGYRVLAGNGSSVDAVVAAVLILENNSLFNAGKGSVFTNEGTHEMDAAVMCGKTLKAGAVANVTRVKNPILLAESVMNKTQHVFLAGKGAELLAEEFNLEMEKPDYFFDTLRHQQWLAAREAQTVSLDHKDIVTEKKFGTVGAVAMDSSGNLAAATSTGGMTNKRYNRIGDTPVIGSGTYANNNTCAVSCTGHGEYFLRAVAAYDISCLMEYKNLSLQDSCRIVVNEKLVKLGGEGGVIAVDGRGNIELVFNSDGMYRGWIRQNEEQNIAIYK